MHGGVEWRAPYRRQIHHSDASKFKGQGERGEEGCRGGGGWRDLVALGIADAALLEDADALRPEAAHHECDSKEREKTYRRGHDGARRV